MWGLGTALDPGMVQARIFQSSFNLAFFSAFAIVVAVLYNWKNDRIGYWANLIVISAVDIGFIWFVLTPGYVPMFPGILGPTFWILAVIFTTLGIRGIGASNITD